MNLNEVYTVRKESFNAQHAKTTRAFNRIANARLAVAGLILLLFYFGLTFHFLFAFVIPVVATFIFLIIRHAKLYNQNEHYKNLVLINEAEFQVLAGDVSKFQNGAAFLNAKHPYAADLDIFGNYSLFQTINRAGTLVGQKQLAAVLSSPLYTIEELYQRQQMVRELAPKIDFRQNFSAIEKSLNENATDYSELDEWLNHPPFFSHHRLYKILLWILPALVLVTLTLALLSVLPFGYCVVLGILNFSFVGFHLKKVNSFHAYISKKRVLLEKYSALLNLLSYEKFEHKHLTTIAEGSQVHMRAIKRLSTLVYALDGRLNILMNLVVNGLFLYDLQIVLRLEEWKQENNRVLNTWFEKIAELDVLNSLATFYYNHPDYKFPEFTNALALSGKATGHPLISEKDCIRNTFSFSQAENVMIITGANMAGKSTFLRAVGLNVVLALAGAPVFADNFICPIIHIRSGMRTSDSLHDHQSYFYNELNRLKGIVEEIKQGIPLLLLLDEILKGTNSNDKLIGSIALVKQLVQAGSLSMIATHDIALGDLEDEFPERIRNFSFEAIIQKDQLHFDYKLKRGVATTMNATFLMKQMGIIPH